MKTSYLVDTGIFVKHFRRDERATDLLDNLLERNGAAISVLTATELLVGCKDRKEYQDTHLFLKLFPIIGVDFDIAEVAVKVIQRRPDYFGKGVERGAVDAFIAATAIANSLTLVTLNRKHFARLKYPGFKQVILQERDKEWRV